MFANVVIIVLVTSVVWVGHNRAASSALPLLNQSAEDAETPAPLDPISSADIAANIARATNIPEVVAVSNQADSAGAQVVAATAEETVVAKPQFVVGGSKSKEDIKQYTTVDGDTVSSLSVKFGVTTDSIKWSNGLTADTVVAGKTLKIPPSNGIVYKVASGDTVDSIATKYNANKEQLMFVNNLDIEKQGNFKLGETILIPDGVQPITTSNRSTRTASTNNSSASVYGFSPIYGDNGYVRGYCTYYVASRISVPKNWGNANTWDNYARASGWTVSSAPRAGAILQTDTGWAGHVGIVEAVSEDGKMIKFSDMNGIAGFGRVGYSDWVPASSYPHYIYR